MTSAHTRSPPRSRRRTARRSFPSYLDLRCGDDSWHAQQGEDKIHRTNGECACFRGPTELKRSAAHDLGSGCDVDEVTRFMPSVVVMPGQRDEARGANGSAKHVTAEGRTQCGSLVGMAPYAPKLHPTSGLSSCPFPAMTPPHQPPAGGMPATVSTCVPLT